MKQITKVVEPNSLVHHRVNQPAFFDNLPLIAKEDLRQSLLSEQGHICCYCTKRIPEKVEINGAVNYEMKVEHFQCQDNFPLLQLTYSNLLGACTGNEGKPRILQTCDTKKGNTVLTINPTLNLPNCESLFKYTADGEMCSINDDEEINRQLSDVLNLNMQTLKDGRREVYLEVQRKVEAESRQVANRQLKVRFFEQERNNWLIRTGNKHKPYCMVAVYYLTKKIRQNQN
jgi:uncharacterized protein (TIGR02646 family)